MWTYKRMTGHTKTKLSTASLTDQKTKGEKHGGTNAQSQVGVNPDHYPSSSSPKA